MEYLLGSQLAHHPPPGTAPCTQAVLSHRATPSPCLLSLSFLRASLCWSTPAMTAIPLYLCDPKKIMASDGRQISSSSRLFPRLCVQALPRGTLVFRWVFPSQCPVGTPCFHAIACKQLRWPCSPLFCWFCVPLYTYCPGPFACNGVCHVFTGLLVPWVAV